MQEDIQGLYRHALLLCLPQHYPWRTARIKKELQQTNQEKIDHNRNHHKHKSIISNIRTYITLGSICVASLGIEGKPRGVDLLLLQFCLSCKPCVLVKLFRHDILRFATRLQPAKCPLVAAIMEHTP